MAADPPQREAPDGAPVEPEASTLTAVAHSATPTGRVVPAVVLPPLEMVDSYDIGDELSQGGLGRLFRARDRRLGREVAIKEMRFQGTDLEVRFRREAEITARLQHPAIIPIYEAGRRPSGESFYAMKLVSGRSLKEVIAATRNLDERLALLPHVLAVAEAMAYAHSQRIVHRDLKPANVMVGEFGETIVIDWGLAKDLAATGDEDAPAASPGGGDGELTGAGAVLGTPAYMPPEQALGQPVDERADVYAIGAMLYTALTGTAPYRGTSSDALLAEVVRASPAPLERREPGVPRELSAIVDKSMAREPEARYPTARELAEDLRRFQTGQLVIAHRYSPIQLVGRWLRRKRLAVGVVMGAALLLGVAAASPYLFLRRALCRGGDERFARVRSPERKRAIHDNLLGTGRSYAASAWAGVERALDAYQTGWTAMHRDACEATRVRGEQSEEVLQLRMLCLESRLDEAGALLSILGNADGSSDRLDGVGRAAQALTPVADCSDVAALSAPVKPPADPAARVQVTALRRQLAEAKAQEKAGRYKEARVGALAVRDAARPISYAPLEAEADLLLGEVDQKLGDHASAESELVDAVLAAEAGNHDEVVARAWITLVEVVGYDNDRPVEGRRDARHAEAALRRLRGPHKELAGELHDRKASVAVREGKTEEAIDEERQALALLQQALGPDHLEVARVMVNLAIALQPGRHDVEALDNFERAAAIYRRSLGEDHPSMATLHYNLGTAYYGVGRLADTEREYRAAIAISVARFGANHPDLAWYWQALGELQLLRDDVAGAQASVERALAIRTAILDPMHVDLGGAEGRLGEIAIVAHRYAEALPHLRRALEIQEKAAPGSAQLVSWLSDLADAELGLSAPREALRFAERAVRTAVALQLTPLQSSAAWFSLARALAATGGDLLRARSLAAEAEEAMRKDATHLQRELHDIAAWRAQHDSSVARSK